MTTATKPLPPHGDHRRYWKGCRCTPCAKAATRYNRRCTFLRETGRGLLRPSTRAAAHIAALRAAGMEDRDIFRAASITHDTLYRIMRGETSVYVTTEQRILAVLVPEGGPVRSCTHVPATGTIRRLRALVAAGWYPTAIARRLDNHPEYIQYLVNGRGGNTVLLRIAEAVRALYEELSEQRPEDHGLIPWRVQQARVTSTARRWPDPTFWEDWGGIDDPNAPETEPPAKRGTYAEARHRAEEIRHLASFGISHKEIAARVSTPSQKITAKRVREVLSDRGPGWRQQQEVAA